MSGQTGFRGIRTLPRTCGAYRNSWPCGWSRLRQRWHSSCKLGERPDVANENGPEQSLLMKVKEESEKAGLKFNIQNTKIMASDPITSWQTDGETMETVTDFIFLGSKITSDGECRHEIKRRLFLGRKAMTNLDSILKSRDITLPTKVHLVKNMVFPAVMYGCESWTIKKPKNWCFCTVVLEKTLERLLDCKEIQPVYPGRN